MSDNGSGDLYVPLSPAEVVARAANVDRTSMAGVVVNAALIDRPAGMQVVLAMTMADLRRLTGAAAFPMIAIASPATFLTAR